jgi:hypothetical protein
MAGKFNLFILDIQLAAIDHTNYSQLDRYDTSAQDIVGIRAVVHQVELGDDGESAAALGIGVARQLQRLRRREVRVGRGHGQDDRVRVVCVVEDHLADLLLDVDRLIAHGHLGQAGQVDQCECDHAWRVDLEHDGLLRDALVLACHAVGLGLDLRANLVKVGEDLVLEVQKDAPLLSVSGSLLSFFFLLIFQIIKVILENEDN